MAAHPEEDDGVEESNNHCCISHEFFKAATRNPNKIAVIHASGGAQVSREFRNNLATVDSSSSSSSSEFRNEADRFFDERAKSMSPPMYDGDRCFTFADVLASVDSLSYRLSSILVGDLDPDLIRPTDNGNCREHGEIEQMSKPSMFFTPSVEQKTELKNSYTPKILGIFMPPSVEYVIAVLSVLRCGEAFLPLDPSWPKERILLIVSSSNIDLIISCESLLGKSGRQWLDSLHWLVECSKCSVLQFSMQEKVKKPKDSLDVVWPCKGGQHGLFCYLMYTSGSTGKPKGVCGTEQGLLNRFLWMQELYPLHGEEILLFKTSISFIDHLQEFLGSVFTGCTLVIPPFYELKDSSFSVADFLQAYLINRLTAVPSLMRVVLPSIQNQYNTRVPSSLKLLVLSGEVLPFSLWDMLSNILTKTSILNIYGSTEVSGDCTYFDCKRLPMILKTETLTSVPIGMPISNCDVVLVGDKDAPHQGEIYVGGLCVSAGYLSETAITSLDYVQLLKNSDSDCSTNECGKQIYFRTGDFARRLQSGDLLFLGRKDRTFKVNGQRIALEEIENSLKGHPDVVDAVVISRRGQGDFLLIEAFVISNKKLKSSELRSSIRGWMVKKLPSAMIPNHFIFTDSFPRTSSGKVDYESLENSAFLSRHVQDEISVIQTSDLLQVIKKAFCDALMMEKVSDDDDFFMMGGNSIVAAHVSHNLGIDMRLLYNCPTPSKLQKALLESKGLCTVNWQMGVDPSGGNMFQSANPDTILGPQPQGWNDNYAASCKRFKVDCNMYFTSRNPSPKYGDPWKSGSLPKSCSFSRGNKVMYDGGYGVNGLCQKIWPAVPRNRMGCMGELWKVYTEACVDASPVVVFKDPDIYLFIGSHSHKFLCVNARSGSVQWEMELGGRIECSVAITEDFSQVVVGCYDGKIYFLDFSTGNICWTFQTCSEVKSQPVVDRCRQLIWCGSHDHNLYALDYKNHCCFFKLSCGGSIYGSPAIDEVHDTLYVASTSGRLTAVSITKDIPFNTLWLLELEVPVFGSLLITPNGNVICCLVDGHVLALDSSGTITWRYRTGGPIFAGACSSYVLPSQVLISSRNGNIYSFEPEKGDLLWEYNVGDPITASVYIDENMQLRSDYAHDPDRLVCVSSSSGTIYMLLINSDVTGQKNKSKITVKEFAHLKLKGDVFSSPVMIGGRIFVGCRDDFVYCISVEADRVVEE